MADDLTRFKDFVGGTVIHVSWPSLITLVAAIALGLWLARRKR